MNNWFYFSGIRSVSLALCDMLTGLVVKKIDGMGNVTNTVEVPLKFGIKEKFYYWLNDKKQEIMFPVMGVHLTQLQYASDRATAKLDKIYLGTDTAGDTVRETFAPSPWKITYNLAIASKTVIELEQILEQILPFFNPFVMVNVTLPEIDLSYDAKVILGTVSPETETTLAMDESRHQMWNLEFTVDAWLFKPINDVKLVHKIITNLHLLPENKLVAQGILDGTTDPVSYKLLEKDFYQGLPK